MDWTRSKEEFFDAVKKAKEIGDQKIRDEGLAAIMRSGNGFVDGDDKVRPQWQAWAWILERRFPSEFALQRNLQHSGALAIAENPLAGMTPDERKKVRAAVVARITGDDEKG
jgi:hypothetical protein